MPVPAVKGYMALCVTPRSKVCDEQGIGQWPMWKRFDSIKAIIDQYVDEPYRLFLARPEYEVDKLKPEEYFYWYTPRIDAVYTRLSKSGDDYQYFKRLLDETLRHYQSVVERLKGEGRVEEAEFLQLSLKNVGDSEDVIYCGDGRVVATVWGMRPRDVNDIHDSKLEADLFPPTDIHVVRYEIGDNGSTDGQTLIKKSHGSIIYSSQIPQVTANDGYEFIGWNRNPIGVTVNEDLSFIAQYSKNVQQVTPDSKDKTEMHHVRFLTPDGQVIKEIDVEHNRQVLPGCIPRLPAIDGVFCSGWDGDPLNDIIVADRDFTALKPTSTEQPMHTVRFLSPEEEVLSQFQVADGTQLSQSQVPDLPVVDGKTCPGWDKDPLAIKITADTDFTAKRPENNKGCLSALLNWLLLIAGLILLFLLLWCFIFDKCHFNLCGCDCNDRIVPPSIVIPDSTNVIPDNNDLPPGPVIQNPCNTEQASGGEEGYMGYFDMGQQSGTFLFQYNTQYVPDKITIYDGKGKSGPVIFTYEGGTSDWLTADVQFHNRFVTVNIEGLENGTVWDFVINCPMN